MKIKKNIPLIDQHDKNGFGWKIWRKFYSETLKKPVEELTRNLKNLEKIKNF